MQLLQDNPTEKLPKILFISDEIPQSINAGSIQFLRLFKNYPEDKIIVIGKEVAKNATKLNCRYYTVSYPLAERLRVTRFTSYFSDLQALGLLLKPLPASLLKVADDFKPDVVISLLQNITYYYPAYAYAKRKKIPLLLFCHDDVEEFSRVHPIFLNALLRRNTRIYSFAKKQYCISPQMVKEWHKKYGVIGEYLYPVASESLSPRCLKKSQNLKSINSITLGYAGSLAYGYFEGILEIIPLLEKAKAVLRIYKDVDQRLPNSTSIVFAGFAHTPEETWERIKEECDAVILPYSSAENFKKLYTTHFPSKLPEYTTLGMPVIVNGPNYSSGYIWARANAQAVLATNTNTLEETLENLKDSSIRMRLAEKVIQIKDFSFEYSYNKLVTDLKLLGK